MRNILLLLTIALLNWNAAQASYLGTNLPALAEGSNIIVYGRIVAVEQATFKVAVIKRIRLSVASDTLTIRKFHNWTCAARYTEYKTGQEAVFFLQLTKDNKLRVMGAANEGELIVRSNTAYIRDYGQERVTSSTIQFISSYSKFISIDIGTVIKGLRLYIDNLEAITKELKNDSPGTVAYQYSHIKRLPRNDFLDILIDQKQKGL